LIPGGVDPALQPKPALTAAAREAAGPQAIVSGAIFAEISVGAVQPNPRQPRSDFDEQAMSELIESIREVGLLQPVVVRATHSGYELVMGERRLRAARAAGLDVIPAIVRVTPDDHLLRDALLENLHRAQLNPLEEAAAYQQLLDDFGCTQDELAARIGRSRPHISNTMRLLRLPPPVQRKVAAGVLSAGHARALLALDDAVEQERFASRCVVEGMSVRGLEELIALGVRPPVPSPRSSGPPRPELQEFGDRLAERLDTRCRVELGARKGKILIEFASFEDLQRILAVMGIDPT
jgi:ParB family chromosome partitioning protein